jgi:hypothetical protein
MMDGCTLETFKDSRLSKFDPIEAWSKILDPLEESQVVVGMDTRVDDFTEASIYEWIVGTT